MIFNTILNTLFNINFLVDLVNFAPIMYLILVALMVYGLVANRLTLQFKIVITLFYFLYLLPGLMLCGAFGMMMFDAPRSELFWGPYIGYGLIFFLGIILPGIGILAICKKTTA